MTPERWRRVEEIFQRAAERAPEDRAAFLDEACPDDQELRREIESMLEERSSEGLLDRPVMDVAAVLLATHTIDQTRDLAGHRISHYEIIEKLGEGGMGAVYKARDTRLRRPVAIKVVDAEFTQRFEREARAIAALNHPHICTLYEVGEHEGAPYLVMEYVEGRPLKGPLPVSEALRYAIQTAGALAAAHRAGIVHRDLKPDNILVTNDGNVKVLDFGLAKLQPMPRADATTLTTITEKGVLAGTGPYMSPEQARGEPVDARSDTFSFGAVLYELLSGKRAFYRETLGATLAAVIASEPPPLKETPPEVIHIVAKMLAKKREDRYQSAEQLLADLERVARPEHWFLPRRLWFFQQLGWLRTLAIGLALVAVLILGTLWWAGRRGAVPPDPGVVASSYATVLQRAQELLRRYDQAGNVDRAIEALQTALKRSPSSAALHACLAEACVRKYRQTPDQKWLQLAIESGRQAVAANEFLEASHVALGMALASNGRNGEAVREFERARDLNPLSSPAYLGLAKLNSGPNAEQLYHKAVQFSRDWITLGELATFYHLEARYDESIDYWRQAHALANDNVMVLGNLAGELFLNGQYEEAAKTFQAALQLDDTNARTWANFGTASYFQGRYQDAVRAMQKAVELAPDRYLYWGNLGDSRRWAEGQKKRAASAYREAIRLARGQLAITPGDTGIRCSLAEYLAKLGDMAGALAELARVDKGPERDTGALFKTALVYELAGKRDEALKTLERAIRAGYSKHKIANEPELADLRSDPRYLPIAGTGAALTK